MKRKKKRYFLNVFENSLSLLDFLVVDVFFFALSLSLSNKTLPLSKHPKMVNKLLLGTEFLLKDHALP